MDFLSTTATAAPVTSTTASAAVASTIAPAISSATAIATVAVTVATFAVLALVTIATASAVAIARAEATTGSWLAITRRSLPAFAIAQTAVSIAITFTLGGEIGGRDIGARAAANSEQHQSEEKNNH